MRHDASCEYEDDEALDCKDYDCCDGEGEDALGAHCEERSKRMGNDYGWTEIYDFKDAKLTTMRSRFQWTTLMLILLALVLIVEGSELAIDADCENNADTQRQPLRVFLYHFSCPCPNLSEFSTIFCDQRHPKTNGPPFGAFDSPQPYTCDPGCTFVGSCRGVR